MFIILMKFKLIVIYNFRGMCKFFLDWWLMFFLGFVSWNLIKIISDMYIVYVDFVCCI